MATACGPAGPPQHPEGRRGRLRREALGDGAQSLEPPPPAVFRGQDRSRHHQHWGAQLTWAPRCLPGPPTHLTQTHIHTQQLLGSPPLTQPPLLRHPSRVPLVHPPSLSRSVCHSVPHLSIPCFSLSSRLFVSLPLYFSLSPSLPLSFLSQSLSLVLCSISPSLSENATPPTCKPEEPPAPAVTPHLPPNSPTGPACRAVGPQAGWGGGSAPSLPISCPAGPQ